MFIPNLHLEGCQLWQKWESTSFNFFTQRYKNTKAPIAGAARYPEALTMNLHKVIFAIDKSKYHSTVEQVRIETSYLNQRYYKVLWLGEISITSDRQMTPPLWQKVKRN